MMMIQFPFYSDCRKYVACNTVALLTAYTVATESLFMRLCPLLNIYFIFFRISVDRAIFISKEVPITPLIWTCFRRFFFPQLRERGLEAKAVLQQDGAPRIILSQLENILKTDSVDDGFDEGLTWCGLIEVQTLQHVTIRIGALWKIKFLNCN
jgi:hypothetical protein